MLTPKNQTVQVRSHTNWAPVKIALIKSIHKGILFDRKYWAKRLKTGDILKPIYFSSTIMGDKTQKLNGRALGFRCMRSGLLFVSSDQMSQGQKCSHR